MFWLCSLDFCEQQCYHCFWSYTETYRIVNTCILYCIDLCIVCLRFSAENVYVNGYTLQNYIFCCFILQMDIPPKTDSSSYSCFLQCKDLGSSSLHKSVTWQSMLLIYWSKDCIGKKSHKQTQHLVISMGSKLQAVIDWKGISTFIIKGYLVLAGSYVLLYMSHQICVCMKMPIIVIIKHTFLKPLKRKSTWHTLRWSLTPCT